MTNPEYIQGRVNVSNQSLKFYYITKPGNGKHRMLWLHGWALGPEYNKDILDTIADYMDIIAPDLNSIRLPSRLEDQAKLLHKFWKKVDGTPCYVAGYSYGGTLAMYFAAYSRYALNDIAIVNPIIRPNTKNPFKLFLSGLVKNVKESAGVKGIKASLLNARLTIPFFGNVASNPMEFYRRLQSLCAPKKRIRLNKRVGLIRGISDEYMDHDDEDSQRLKRAIMPKLEEIVLEDQISHSWPLMDPDTASDEILSYITG